MMNWYNAGHHVLSKDNPMVVAQVWTDGSISKNPGGDMGWAARIEFHGAPGASSSEPLVLHTWSSKAAAPANTNQVAEMLAIRAALMVLEGHRGITRVELTSDSEWCIKQISRPIFLKTGVKPWSRNTYIEEWAEIELMAYSYAEFDPRHIRGHMKAGDWRNEECDKLATAARKGPITEQALANILAFGKKHSEQQSIPGNPGSERSAAES
jgi:ribonuclease HI